MGSNNRIVRHTLHVVLENTVRWHTEDTTELSRTPEVGEYVYLENAEMLFRVVAVAHVVPDPNAPADELASIQVKLFVRPVINFIDDCKAFPIGD